MRTVERRTGIVIVAALLAVACAGDPGPPEAEVVDAFETLHRRVYEVYGLGIDRDAIHELLARSFDGEALTREYVEHFTTLARMAEESTAIRVLAVDYESVDVVERGDGWARLDADWSVGGIVTHQGHRHPRTNRYRAVYTLARADDGWRIVDTRMRDMQRLRGYDSIAGDDPDAGATKSRRGMLDPLEMLRAGLAEDVRQAAEEREAREADEPPPDEPPPEEP